MRLYTKPAMDTYPLLAYCILQAKYRKWTMLRNSNAEGLTPLQNVEQEV